MLPFNLTVFVEEVTGMSITNVTDSEAGIALTTLQKRLNVIQEIINYYLPLVMLPFGLFGNVMLFFVMIMPHNRSHAQCVYMACLSIADFIITSCGLFTAWLFFNVLDHTLYPEVCPILSFLIHAVIQISAYLLVFMTLDRLLSIRYPYKFKNYSSPKTALIVVSGLTLLLLGLNVHGLWTFRLILFQGHYYCIIPEPEWWAIAYDWVVLVIASCIPFITLLIMNIALIVTITKSEVVGESIDHKKRALAQRRITRSLLSVSFAFLILSAPYRVEITIWKFIDIGDNITLNAAKLLIHRIAHKMWYLNNCINFYLYVATGGAKFRQDAMNLLVGRCRRREQSGTSSASAHT